MGRFFAAVTGIVLLASCQTGTHAVFSPLPSPSPHTAATAAILRPGEAPSGLNVCLGSGPMDVYLETLASANASIAQKVAGEWEQELTAGAQSGAIAIYAAGQPACAAELGATSGVQAATSVVAVFRSEGEADRAWQSGFFGFTPPEPGEAAPGLTLGTATGLGLSSFAFDRPPVRLACWHRSVFVALVVFSNLDLASFAAATAAVDARLN